jgi:hypothetical protein
MIRSHFIGRVVTWSVIAPSFWRVPTCVQSLFLRPSLFAGLLEDMSSARLQQAHRYQLAPSHPHHRQRLNPKSTIRIPKNPIQNT